MTRTPVTVAAVDTLTLSVLYNKAGITSMQEDRAVVNEGYLVSFIGAQEPGGPVFALVKAPSDEAYAAIDEAFAGNINIANTPVRSFLGETPPAPEVGVSRKQLRLALEELGLRDAVEKAVAASEAKVQIWWQDSANFLKSNEMVQAMAAGLGVTPEALDQLWLLAATKA